MPLMHSLGVVDECLGSVSAVHLDSHNCSLVHTAASQRQSCCVPPKSVVLVIQIILESIWFQFSMFQSPNTNVLWNQGRTGSSIQPGSPAVLSSCTHPGQGEPSVNLSFLSRTTRSSLRRSQGCGNWQWLNGTGYQQTDDSTPLIIVMAPKMNGPEMSPQITPKIYDGE